MPKYVYNALNLKVIKTKNNLKNKDLEKILGKTCNTITKYLNGNFKLSGEQIALICNALPGTTPKDFFDVID